MIFGKHNVKDERPDAADQDALLLTQLRIYDVLLAMYKDQNPEAAQRLEALHVAGGLGAPMVNFVPDNLLST